MPRREKRSVAGARSSSPPNPSISTIALPLSHHLRPLQSSKPCTLGGNSMTPGPQRPRCRTGHYYLAPANSPSASKNDKTRNTVVCVLGYRGNSGHKQGWFCMESVSRLNAPPKYSTKPQSVSSFAGAHFHVLHALLGPRAFLSFMSRGTGLAP